MDFTAILPTIYVTITLMNSAPTVSPDPIRISERTRVVYTLDKNSQKNGYFISGHSVDTPCLGGTVQGTGSNDLSAYTTIADPFNRLEPTACGTFVNTRKITLTIKNTQNPGVTIVIDPADNGFPYT